MPARWRTCSTGKKRGLDLSRGECGDGTAATLPRRKRRLMDGGRTGIRGFGSFGLREHGACKGRTPHTGESVDVKAKRTPFLKCGKELKDMLNEGNA